MKKFRGRRRRGFRSFAFNSTKYVTDPRLGANWTSVLTAKMYRKCLNNTKQYPMILTCKHNVYNPGVATAQTAYTIPLNFPGIINDGRQSAIVLADVRPALFNQLLYWFNSQSPMFDEYTVDKLVVEVRPTTTSVATLNIAGAAPVAQNLPYLDLTCARDYDDSSLLASESKALDQTAKVFPNNRIARYVIKNKTTHGNRWVNTSITSNAGFAAFVAGSTTITSSTTIPEDFLASIKLFFKNMGYAYSSTVPNAELYLKWYIRFRGISVQT